MLKKLDKMLCWLEEGVTVSCYFAMTLVVLWSVLCRYALKIPFVYGDEAARYLTIYSVFIGVSLGARKGVHLGVEAFVDMLPPRLSRAVQLGSAGFTMVMFFVLAWATFVMSMKIFSTGQHSSSLHIPMWMIYMSMPIGMFMSGIRETQCFVAKVKQYRQTAHTA